MLITMITATYNSEEYLPAALNSFRQQKYAAKELLVIDGNSQDETLNIIKAYKDCITDSRSEKDQGIYDALNKGIALAKGDIIGVLHSDDFFASEDVLNRVAEKFKKDSELMAVYGDLEYVDRIDSNKVIRYWQSGPFSRRKIKMGWMPPHPTMFIKKECFEKYGHYDLSYRSAADYDLILRFLYKNKLKTDYIPEVLMKMRVGGLSNQSFKNRWRANQEDRKAMRENGIPFPFLMAILKPLSKLGQYFRKNS
jgi:glycosyltransferase